MSYQSEEKLENQLLKKLQDQDYSYIKIEDYAALEVNFREQIQKFNASVLTEPLTDAEFQRINNYLCGKTVFVSAKQLRDQFILERDNGEKVYIHFLDEDPDKNT